MLINHFKFIKHFQEMIHINQQLVLMYVEVRIYKMLRLLNR